MTDSRVVSRDVSRIRCVETRSDLGQTRVIAAETGATSMNGREPAATVRRDRILVMEMSL